MKVAIFYQIDDVDIEDRIQAFLNTKHLKDFYVVQSQSASTNQLGLTLTISIFYNEESY